MRFWAKWVFSFGFLILSHAPCSWAWHSYSTATFNGAGGAGDSLNKIALDSSGNIWTAGYISTASGASPDAWIGKFNSSLTLIASVTLNGVSDKQDTASDIAVDPNGNVWVVGFTSQTNTGFDIWIAKYNSSLTLVSSLTVSGPSGASHYDYGQAVAVGTDGSIYVGGTIDTTTAISVAAGDTGNDGWLAKYDSNFVFVSSFVFRGFSNGFETVSDIVLDGENNVYATGYLWDSHAPPGNNNDIWIAKFNSSLALVSSRTINGPGNYDDRGNAIALDLSSHVYVAGSQGMSSGVDDIWIGKFDGSLNLLSSATFNGPGDSVDSARGVAVDAASNVYVSGTIYDSSQNYDLWFGKFSSSLTLKSSGSYNGPGNYYDSAANMVIDQSGSAYAGGIIYTSTQGSSADIWLGKFNLTLAGTPALSAAAALGASSITWSWSYQNLHEDGFRVVDASSNNLSGNLTELSWTETGLSTNTSYGRRLAAYNAFGASTSTAVSLYTLAAPPTGLTLLGVGQSSAAIQWSSNTNSAGTNYRLDYWALSGATTSATVAVTTAALSDLSAGTTYFIRVAAINSLGLTSMGETISTITLVGLIAPSAATPLFSNVQTSSFTVSWTSGSAISGYNGSSVGYIVKIASYSSESAAFVSSATTAISAVITGLSPNVTHYAWAAAYIQGSTTSFTSLGSTVTLPAAPASIAISSVSYFFLEVSWNRNGNPDGTLFEAQLSSSDFPNSYTGNQSSRTTSALSAFFGLSYG
ncbi:MAG: fibronectin type III domain-containing protein, partial [Elusimicrobia bacterium]|nr:fibronectin type III domain-containing protein [Elusimicrobiota bacterium]